MSVVYLNRQGSDRQGAGRIRNIVLVRGAFVDGSGWEGVHRILTIKGYRVTVVQNPTVSLSQDIDFASRAIAAQDGPVVLAGHCYGGAVVTEAGRDPKVKALVYVAAFVPDAGEAVASLIAGLPSGASIPRALPSRDGFVCVDPGWFALTLAPDVDPAKAAFMTASQVPWGVEAANGKATDPAWRTKPSWYLVAAGDRILPASAQHTMAARAHAHVKETAGSHAVHVSKPETVAAQIEQAAEHALAPAA